MKTKGEIAEYLQKVSLFSRCSRKDLASIAKLTEIEQYEPGATIVAEGAPGNAFYVVLEGAVKIALPGEFGQEALVALLIRAPRPPSRPAPLA